MANMIARLGVVLGLDTAEFNRGIEQAGKKLEQISQAAEKFSKIGVTAMAAASAAALAYADEIADVAQANEVAIGTVLKLSNALANAGGKADNTGKMLASFTKFIDDAAGGSLQAQKTAAMLGVTLQDLGKLSEEELLNKVVKNLGEMDDSVTRNAKGMELFGKAAKGVDFVGFAEEMAQTNKLTEEQAVAIKQAADAHDMLAQNARDTMVVIGSALGPVLKTSIEYLKDMKGETNALGQVFKTVFETIAVVAANVSFVIKTLIEDFAAIGKAGVALFKGDFAEIERIYTQATERAKQDRAKLDKFELNILSPSSQASDSGSSSTPQVAGRKVIKARDPEAERAERERLRWIRHMNEEAKKYAKLLFDIEAQQVQAYTNESKRIEKEQRALEIRNGLLDIEIQTRDMRSEDIQLAKELYLAEQKRLDTIQEINRNNLLDEDAKTQLIERENALADATERYLRAQNQAVKAQREGSFGEGFMKEGNKFFRDMPTELENGAKAFQSVMGNMESALDNFVRTGKLSFKSLARSIIQDLIAIQLKASASSLFKSFLGGFGFMNDKGGMEVSGSLGFADGGEPPVGKASIVGERGPELFVPRSAGTIIPNHALAGMGGTTNVTNNYINAIDTKSFEERLYGSSNAIWAANQYANKSLAVNRGRA
jgi:lambda family phage tail tape measure protein